MEETKTRTPLHPCFDAGAKATHGRIHLPVAPRCNIQCMFCNRVEDCVNESRPGVTSRVMAPRPAVEYMLKVLKAVPTLSVVGIAGPGDPLANTDAVFETLRLVREAAPDMLACLSTNGLGLTSENVEELVSLGVKHVTVTVNAVDPEIGAQIYARVREDRVWFGLPGAELLLSRQLAGISALKARGVIVKVNTVVVAGVNDQHVGDIARTVADLGADVHNCMAMIPTKGTPFAHLPELTHVQMAEVRARSGRYLKQMSHCSRCRADAVGFLGQDRALEFAPDHIREDVATWTGAKRDYVAVATMEGVLVNMHLGVADHVQIWRDGAEGFELVEDRLCPSAGSEGRWDELGKELEDCRAILVAAAGESPRKTLEKYGLLTLEMEGAIDDCLEKVFHGNAAVAYLEKRNNMGKACGCGKVRTGAGEGGCGA